MPSAEPNVQISCDKGKTHIAVHTNGLISVMSHLPNQLAEFFVLAAGDQTRVSVFMKRDELRELRNQISAMLNKLEATVE